MLTACPMTMNRMNIPPTASLADLAELESPKFRRFMNRLNKLAGRWGLRQIENWSKAWEYPWLWFNALSNLDWANLKVVDLGSERSPMPWFLASLGARVIIVETSKRWLLTWEKLRRKTGLDVSWLIVSDETLFFEDESVDAVTSFSVVEHQRDKSMAVNEMVRLLKPGGTLAMSFDICEPAMGMTYPERHGSAFTMKDFEKIVWDHPGLQNDGRRPHWNKENIPDFIRWHLGSADYHNYTVAAAVLKKQ